MPYKDKEKQTEYQRVWLQRRRESFFKDKCCVVCGSKDNLELDHIDPKKKVTHRIWSWSAARRSVELAKCQVLCKDHHARKTLVDISDRLGRELYAHGVYTTYRLHKCRCKLCVAAHKETRRRWRETAAAKQAQSVV